MSPKEDGSSLTKALYLSAACGLLAALPFLLKTNAETEKWAAANPLPANLLTSAVWAYGALVAQRVLVPVATRLRMLLHPQPIDICLRGQSVVHLVLPDINGPSLDGGNTVLPLNCPLLPFGDARGALLIASHITASCHNRIAIRYHYGTAKKGIEDDDLIISIGGPNVNPTTHFNTVAKPFPGFHLEGESIIHENGLDYAASVTGRPPAHYVTQDYGVVCCRHSADDIRRRTIFLWGIWPFGTLAACELFVGKMFPRRSTIFEVLIYKCKSMLSLYMAREISWSERDKYKMLKNSLAAKSDFIAILRSEDQGEEAFRRTLLSVRTITN